MRFILKLLLLVLLLGAGLYAWLQHAARQPLELHTAEQELLIKRGGNLRTVAQQLVDEHVLREPWSFMLLVRAEGRAGAIKAGNYLLEQGMTIHDLSELLTNGSTVQRNITFIEGWNFRQVRAALNSNEAVRHLAMHLTDAEIMTKLGVPNQHPEGMFFPDSYFFSENMSDLEILARAYVAMQKKMDAAWRNRAADLPYTTPYQAMIMASIVEKETARGDERPLIARVFLNRLRIGMRLQTDPTVIYGLGERYDGNIHKKDLLEDTPYNTYTRAGLPPTPIAMPGMAAIEAVLHPASGAALYFVSRGDGSHVFSDNLADHNRAVARYQLRR